MNNRGYQDNFSLLYNDLSNSEKQQQKAQKAEFILSEVVDLSAKEAVWLDLGCSTGIFSDHFSEFASEFYGIDYDKTALFHSPKKPASNTTFINGDAMGLPFKNDSFDRIICAQVYEHVPNDLKLFSEIYRTLKPGGYVFFSGPNKTYPIEPHYFLPFLHWLPEKFADRYLQILKKGDHYYERSRSYADLKRRLSSFFIIDFSFYVFHYFYNNENSKLKKMVFKILANSPIFFQQLMIPLLPNFNWVMVKPTKNDSLRKYEIFHKE
jgi:SAM-dependent methyltransferase